MSEADTAHYSDYEPNERMHGETTPPRRNHRTHDCKHVLNPDGGHNLGRDDPLWPQYVEEAEKWDDIMMQKWNRYEPILYDGYAYLGVVSFRSSMDNLLRKYIFVTLLILVTKVRDFWL